MALLLDAADSRREDGREGRIEGEMIGREEESSLSVSGLVSESSELCCELMKSVDPQLLVNSPILRLQIPPSRAPQR
jgi:hypothetical protein